MEYPGGNEVTAVFRRGTDDDSITITMRGHRKEDLSVLIGEAVLRLVFAANLGLDLEDFVPRPQGDREHPYSDTPLGRDFPYSQAGLATYR
jgi:hypothetical protein